MNAMIEMPDHGGANADHLGHFDKVFSGHFHKRQARKNVWYMGNAFPHNYADAGDDARGMMVLEWDKEPEFHSWPDQPVYRVYKLSEVLENPEGLLIKNAHVRVHLDIDISYEESNFIREQFIPQHELREMSLIPIKNDEHSQDLAPGEISFESVDSIIIEQIKNIESDFYDKGVLLEIYQSLMIKLKNVTLRNFLSVGSVTQAVDLDNQELTLILGDNLDLGGDGARNGTGKTTLIQAVSYALYGTALNNIKANNLINRTNSKGMMVTLDFEANGVEYRIERGRKPNVLKILY